MYLHGLLLLDYVLKENDRGTSLAVSVVAGRAVPSEAGRRQCGIRPHSREPTHSRHHPATTRIERALSHLTSLRNFLRLQRRNGSKILPCQEAWLSPSDSDIFEETNYKTREQKTKSTHGQEDLSGVDCSGTTRTSHLPNPPDPLRARYGPTIFDTFILHCLVSFAVTCDALHHSRRPRMGCCQR